MTSAAPNSAETTVARLETDQQTARKLAASFSECFADGAIAVSLVDNGRGRWAVAVHFPAGADEAAVRTLATAAAGPGAANALRFERVAARDWVGESLAGLAPVRAGCFVVHGAHDRAGIAPNRIGIEIEAALAFGTGHHGTTRGCLIALDQIYRTIGRRQPLSSRPHPEVRAKRASNDAGQGTEAAVLRGSALRAEYLRMRAQRLHILDLGTGSGVLAIAAARALRAPVLATDIDAAAVRVARANAQLNGVAPLVTIVRANGVAGGLLRTRAPFDLVFANILLGPLQRFAAPLTRLIAPAGRIVLSGILTSQANAALSAYRPLALERRIDLDGWTTLVLRRPPRLPLGRICS